MEVRLQAPEICSLEMLVEQTYCLGLEAVDFRIHCDLKLHGFLLVDGLVFGNHPIVAELEGRILETLKDIDLGIKVDGSLFLTPFTNGSILFHGFVNFVPIDSLELARSLTFGILVIL